VADVDAKATRAAELRKAQRRALLAALTAWPVDITGHEGYMKVRSTSPHVTQMLQAPIALMDRAALGSGKCVLWLGLFCSCEAMMLCAVLQAEVTGGGIPLSELNCATCESRKLPVRCLSAVLVSRMRPQARHDIRVK
jgi:hypothetical protein